MSWEEFYVALRLVYGWPVTGIVVVPGLVLFGSYLLVRGRLGMPWTRNYESRSLTTRLAGAPLLAYYPFALVLRVAWIWLMHFNREQNVGDRLLASGVCDWVLLVLAVAASVALIVTGMKPVGVQSKRGERDGRRPQVSGPKRQRASVEKRRQENPFDFS